MSKFQIHATNIHGLGASQVVKSFIDSYIKKYGSTNVSLLLSDDSLIPIENISKIKFKIYKRFIHNGLSRFIECFFSRFIFKNIPTIVLGDIPLRGIKNQVVLVHHPYMPYPHVNPSSSKSLNARVIRYLFSINHKYAKTIFVQTGAMAEDMINSYPEIKDKICICPQPAPNWLIQSQKNTIKEIKSNVFYFFYPATYSPYKRHDFLIEIDSYCKENNIDTSHFEIWITLKDDEFLKYNSLSFVKNLGRLNSQEMNNFYNLSDSLLFLSSLETYGLPLIEALTLNLPILAADFKYSRWVCEEEGYYFKNYDVSDFIKKMDILISDLKIDKKNNYSTILKKFPKDWLTVVDQYLKYLNINKN